MLAPKLRVEMETGRSIDCQIYSVRPLGVQALEAILDDPKSKVQMEIVGSDAQVDGREVPGQFHLRQEIVFLEKANIFGLVPCGWLPIPFINPARFLVDRNVILNLKRIREGCTISNGDAYQWWATFFSSHQALFNPLPYAFECGMRRSPTFEEFCRAYDEGAEEIKLAVPGCNVVEHNDRTLQAAYAQLEALNVRNNDEIRFVQAVRPLVIDRVGRSKEKKILAQILQAAADNRLSRRSLVVLAVLSCLYENPSSKGPCIGRAVLKFTRRYGVEDAYNAICDLRSMELAVASQGLLGQEGFALCTGDHGVALMWSALEAKPSRSSMSHLLGYQIEITQAMFSRLVNPAERQALRSELL